MNSVTQYWTPGTEAGGGYSAWKVGPNVWLGFFLALLE